MLEQQSKVATAAQASADKLLIRAKNMKDRFTTFNDKKAKQLATVKQAAKEKVAARERHAVKSSRSRSVKYSPPYTVRQEQQLKRRCL